MTTTIFHNPRCSKSRQTLAILETLTKEIEVIEYLKTPPQPETLNRILDELSMEPLQIIRTKEELFKELGLHEQNHLSRAEWVEILSRNPKLIERPIVSRNGRAILGRPPENVHQLFHP